MLGASFDATLEEARSGSRPALGALYRDLFPGVLGYLRARVPGEAEDLASEVFLDVVSGLHRFSGDESGFRGWVFTIARRRAIDLGRKVSRQATTPVPPEALAELADPADPAAEAVATLRAEQTVALIHRLTKLQADVVLLRVLGGLNVEETATAVGRRPGAVRVLQHRALRRLARMLEVDGRQNGSESPQHDLESRDEEESPTGV